MSVIGSQEWMYATGCGGKFYPYEIDQSLRFNDDDSAYLSKTFASAGNQKTWTWSGWVKRGNLGTKQDIFTEYSGVASDTEIFNLNFSAANKIAVDAYYFNFRVTTQVFRDVSSWYHIALAFDTTQATANDRIKLYVNGVQITDFDTTNNPSLNTDYGVNATAPHYLGRNGVSASAYLDGYLAEVNFIDGQALDATDFGEFKSGVWVPKRYSGTYGTNGFYLSFADSANIGDDLSGNANDWTPTNLADTDQVPDSPTNNFATLNPLWSTLGTLSEGNLKNTTPGSGRGTRASTLAVSSGKYYCEILYTEPVPSLPGSARIGVIRSDSSYAETSSFTDSGFNGIGYVSANGYVTSNGTNTNTGGATYANGDIIGIALDMDASEVAFYKNNTLVYSAINPSSLLDSGSWMFVCADSSNAHGAIFYANFGQDSSFAGNKTAQGNTDANGIGDFYYAPPSGYLALCTANLPCPAIDPALDDVPEDYFNTVLYTGTGSAANVDVGFQPDWIWFKERNGTNSHQLYDAIRGSSAVFSNTTAVEFDYSQHPNGDLSPSFTSNGFQTPSVVNNGINASGQTYVAWNWKANGTGVSNTDGTITSTVSANQKAGFSIVSYTGTGTNGATIGHGLSSAPDLLMVKDRSQAVDWHVYHSANTSAPETEYLILNQNLATIDAIAPWNDTAPTSSVFTVGTGVAVNTNGNNYIAYCFHSVEGYSKFGSYTGNGSSDGPFVYTGFRPAWIMTKRTNVAEDWHIEDVERSTYNPAKTTLWANESYAEADFANGFDILSNGFKLRETGQAVNGSGSTYIYMAFAEMPFKYSLGR